MVDAVIEINATIVATKPNNGIFEPISKPKTNEAQSYINGKILL